MQTSFYLGQFPSFLKKTFFLLLMVLSIGHAYAFQKPDSPAVAVAKPAIKTSVIDVYNSQHTDPADPGHFQAGLGDKITIRVRGLADLLTRATTAGKEIKLFLDSRQIDDIKPVSGAPDKDEGEFEFTLQRTPVNEKAWTDILGKPGKGTFFLRPTKISVGIDGTYAEHSEAKHFEIVRIREHWFYGCLVGLLIYTGALLYLAKVKNILRDTGADLKPLGLTQLSKLPFSLGKVQMAFWFSLVLASFLFIWLITGNYDIITPGILGLIGISATTALGAVAIDDSKDQTTVTDILTLRQQRDVLALAVPPDPVGVAAIQADITKKENSLQLQTDGFLNDIMTDQNGVSFHRLQMFVWTLVLGMIFLYSVWASLIMPDFSATLLTLQGITAGTYLGFKFPEK